MKGSVKYKLLIEAVAYSIDDLIAAAEKALVKLNKGFTSGHDRNEFGDYYRFEVDEAEDADR